MRRSRAQQSPPAAILQPGGLFLPMIPYALISMASLSAIMAMNSPLVGLSWRT